MKTAICAIAKNENEYINDWVKYHLDLGFDEIHIFDNNDVYSEYVGDRIDSNIKKRVYIHPVNFCTHGFQVPVYTSMYNTIGKQYDWIAFIDIDEFIVLNTHNTISDFFNTISDSINVLRLNWQIYGDDDIECGDMSIPVYKRIVKKIEHRYNFHGKSIVRGKLDNVEFKSSHYPYINGVLPMQNLPSGKEVPNATVSIGECEYDIAYIAHYMTKTLEEFKKQKLNRTDAGFDKRLAMDYFYNINRNKVYKQ